MSTTRNILQSEVGFDLTSGEYILAGLFSSTWKYWTGSAWSATFASANLYTFGTSTQLTAATWTWVVPSDVDPTATDDGAIQMRGWESGVTPTLADPPTWAVVDVYAPPTSVTVVATGTSTTDSAVASDLTMKLWQNRDYPITNANCPSWTIEDFTASTITEVNLAVYPIADYEAGTTSTRIIYTFSGGTYITQAAADTVLKTPLTAAQTAALSGSATNLPTHVYQLYITVSGNKLHVAEQVLRVVSAA